MFKCKNCGYTSAKWFGKCPSCGGWEVEEVESELKYTPGGILKTGVKVKGVVPKPIGKVSKKVERQRIQIPLDEVNSVYGGFMPYGVYLLGGEPGVGKSTLALQIAGMLAQTGKPVVYASSEESESQILERFTRLFPKASSTVKNNLHLVCSNVIDEVLPALYDTPPTLVVIDSIQGFITLSSSGIVGGPAQAREVVFKVTDFIKKTGSVGLLIGQVTKGGDVSGPKMVEHIVDVVSYLEYGGMSSLRILRTTKNRFAEVGALGFLEMTSKGFVGAREVYKQWVKEKDKALPGTAYGVVLYGARPLVVQIQALLVDTKFPNPKRVVEGLPRNKVEVLLAILQEHVKAVDFSYKDVFVKALGGINIKDPGVDLAVAAALLSAYFKKGFKDTAFIGELGLLGKVMPAVGQKQRVKEAKSLGFKNIVTPEKVRFVGEIKEWLG